MIKINSAQLLCLDVLGLGSVCDAATAGPKHFFSRILIPISKSDLRVVNLAAIGSTVGTSFGSSFGAISSSWS
jgi:hypothetical protein